MAKPVRFVFVCVNERPEGHPRGSCSMKGGREVLDEFSKVLDGEGLSGEIALVRAGCLGPCMEGPVVAVFPDNHWYGNVRAKDVGEIVRDHIAGGNPVQRLTLVDEDWG